VLLEAINLIQSYLPRNAKAIGKSINGVIVQLVVLGESLSFFNHGNTFPGHGLHLLYQKIVTHTFRIFYDLFTERFHTVFLWLPHEDDADSTLIPLSKRAVGDFRGPLGY
jgi:hypothetical protein